MQVGAAVTVGDRERQQPARVVDQDGRQLLLAEAVLLQPRREAVVQVVQVDVLVEQHRVELVHGPVAVGEEAVVREHQVVEVAGLHQLADRSGQQLVELVDAVVPPRDADVVDLQVRASLADGLEPIHPRIHERVPDDHLCRVRALVLEQVEQLEAGVGDVVVVGLGVRVDGAADELLRAPGRPDAAFLRGSDPQPVGLHRARPVGLGRRTRSPP